MNFKFATFTERTEFGFIPRWIAAGLALALACGGGGGAGEGAAPPGPAPVLAALTPDQGRPGDAVRLTGHHFAGATRVTFGNLPVTFARVAATELRVVLPEGVSTGLVRVTTPGGTTEPGLLFTARSAGFEQAGGVDRLRVAVPFGATSGRIRVQDWDGRSAETAVELTVLPALPAGPPPPLPPRWPVW